MLGPDAGLKRWAMAAWTAIALMVAPVQGAWGATISESDAARFLTQATFGPTPADIARVQALGYAGWLDEQFAMPRELPSHQSYWDQRNAILRKQNDQSSTDEVTASFWKHAITGRDQLRQRMAFALSEIFVVSLADSCGDLQAARGVANFFDTLNEMAFDRYRVVLERVALHPTMGCFLSHLHNEKEDLATGRIPDENFARELMQLFSIGLFELNLNGSPRLNAQGKPIETYQADDVIGLAKVWTGFSWDCPMPRNGGCFLQGVNSATGASYADKWVMPMAPYPQFHSTAEKRFLGMKIASTWLADPMGDVQLALDAIASHPNVAPFISKQLIQRFVTANPSPSYVERVASVFTKSQGQLGAVIRAILLDDEARAAPNTSSDSTFAGKLKEPVLRLSALMRAFDAQSATGAFLMRPTHDPGFGLGQSPLRSPTVFNFFRPGYVAAGSRMAKGGRLNPEMQLVSDVSAAGYVNFMRGFIEFGTGWQGFDRKSGPPDIQLAFNLNDDHPLLTLANTPSDLVNEVDKRLMGGLMNAELKRLITDAVSSIHQPEQLKSRRHRVHTALLLTVASPEFLVQR